MVLETVQLNKTNVKDLVLAEKVEVTDEGLKFTFKNDDYGSKIPDLPEGRKF